jgi:hypothetical protein
MPNIVRSYAYFEKRGTGHSHAIIRVSFSRMEKRGGQNAAIPGFCLDFEQKRGTQDSHSPTESCFLE